MSSLEPMHKINPVDLLKIIQQAKDFLKQDRVMQELCDRYQFDINDIDYIPIKFGNIDVSARTDKGVITLNWKLLEKENRKTIPSYCLHEIGHYIQQSNAPTQSADDGDYLSNPDEQEAFQYQIEYLSEQFGEEKAKDYADQVLDHHNEEGKEREEKKEMLLKKIENLSIHFITKLSNKNLGAV